jgi:hypothetical protein
MDSKMKFRSLYFVLTLAFFLPEFNCQVTNSSMLIQSTFFYKSALRSFSLVAFSLWQNDFSKKNTFTQKIHALNDDEIDHK